MKSINKIASFVLRRRIKRQIVPGCPPVVSFKKTSMELWFSTPISDKIRDA